MKIGVVIVEAILLLGFSVAIQPQNLFYCFIGTLIGTLVGVLPGLGPAASIAILIPFASGLPATSAIIMLAAIYYGAMYGGSTTSILLNIPGEAASVVTALDGYQMARQGRAGPALGMAAISSFIAGTLSLFGLVFLAPPLADFALKFGPPEYLGLIVLGLTVAVSLAGAALKYRLPTQDSSATMTAPAASTMLWIFQSGNGRGVPAYSSLGAPFGNTPSPRATRPSSSSASSLTFMVKRSMSS